jgi:hypothetical protein
MCCLFRAAAGNVTVARIATIDRARDDGSE